MGGPEPGLPPSLEDFCREEVGSHGQGERDGGGGRGAWQGDWGGQEGHFSLGGEEQHPLLLRKFGLPGTRGESGRGADKCGGEAGGKE